MKNLKVVIFGVSLLLGFNKVQAQDTDNKWAVKLGVNIVDVTLGGGKGLINDFLGGSDWNTSVPTISVSRYMENDFSLELGFSFNSIGTLQSKDDLNELSFFAIDIDVKYDLNGPFGETGWIDPFVSLGMGITSIDSDSGITINPGLGVNAWINDKFGLSFSTTYKLSSGNRYPSIKSNDYFHHSLGLVYKFEAKDSDADGISDKKDACPDAAGTKENGGCPDTDGDSVLNKDDNCPNAAGTFENGGWPDTDGDNVLDKDDSCPNAAGTVENGGCPDTDGDRVLDKDDSCPEVAGPIDNKGCVWPDTDKDGVADKDDRCPEVAGTIEKQGCPKLTEVQIKKLGEYSKKIEFNSGKATFKTGVTKELFRLAKVMLEFPTTNFAISGYTDSTGSKTKNLEISKLRAQAVENYLTSQGINPNRLKSVGFGIASPIATNKSAAGRALNRRVEVTAE